MVSENYGTTTGVKQKHDAHCWEKSLGVEIAVWVEMKALNMDGTLKARSLVSWCGHRSERFLSFTLKQGVAKSSQKLKADINEVKESRGFSHTSMKF